MLTFVLKLIKLLNSEDSPAQIAWAVCLASVLGFTPLLSLHNLFIVFLVLIFRVNISAFLLFSALFAGVSYFLVPVFQYLGTHLLEAGALRELWTALYNTGVGRLSHFYNTRVLGGVVAALLAGIPLYFAVLAGVSYFRTRIKPWLEKAQVVRVLKASRVYRLYTELR